LLHLRELIPQVGQKELPETDRYCIECAGFSAITQMEFGIRRAIELGNLPKDANLDLTEKDKETNSAIIRKTRHVSLEKSPSIVIENSP